MDLLLIQHLDTSPITAEQIKHTTRRDPVLSAVMQYVLQGWPHKSAVESNLKPYYDKKEELSVHTGCVLWGARVVIPKNHRADVLKQLHEGHPGITKMKGLSRMYVWWPGITKDIEDTVRDYVECQQNQAAPPVSPLHPWAWPTRPWARLHIDYAGPFEGHMLLIVVDAHSKWVEAIPTAGSTSHVVIEELRFLFSQFGLPESIVSDNGTCFTSSTFNSFLKQHGIAHITSAPYHPSTNGLAERSVQLVKKGLKKVKTGSFRSRIAKVLFAYRLLPQTTTGLSPSELLLGHRPRSRLDLLKPNTAERVDHKQSKQRQKHDLHSRERNFEAGDPVFVRNYHHGDKWIPGEVLRRTGPVSVCVQLHDGRSRRCHHDQIWSRTVETPNLVGVDESTLPQTPPAEIGINWR